ncbi:MAG TPA: hypothetical protein VNQ76_12500 [Planctomicrobium sp.]|nr:hypothetical protein [Planctomicrobium sp.]
MGNAISFVLSCCLLFSTPLIAWGQPDGFEGAVAKTRAEALYVPILQPAAQGHFPKKTKLQQLDDLEFTGPQPSHPFVLGNFISDAEWGIVNGGLQVISGKNSALQIAWANEFRLEGIIEQAGLGGWFLLLGWDEGRGIAVHNVTMKESGSPWFITEFRGGKAIEGRTQEFPYYEWKGEQPFQVQVSDSKLSFNIGRHRLFVEQPIDGYGPGQVIIGTYDTRYGPRPLRIKSLKIQALKPSK